MKAIYIDRMPTLGSFRPMVVEVEPAGKTQMRILSASRSNTPSRAFRGYFIPYSDEIWETCQDMEKQYGILWKMQITLKDMAMKELEG